MQLQRFEAPTIRDALAEVKRTLGPDAVVIATREVAGLFGKRRVEVTAAAAMAPAGLKAGGAGAVKNVPEGSPGASATAHAESERLKEELQALRAAARGEAARSATDLQAPAAVPPAQTAASSLLRSAAVDTQVIAELLADPRLDGGSEALATLLAETMGAARAPRGEPSVVALVGPTGVGKTTTVAKLAARAALIEHKRVGLVTTDTYRVGALDQLKHYADLIGVPLSVVRDRPMLERVVERFADRDLILIDTAGRNPGDDEQIDLLDTILGAPVHGRRISVQLTIAASTGDCELDAILERFLPIGPDALLFTKLDEAFALGALVNATWQTGLALSYVTSGQRVPEDIQRADAAALARQLLSKAALLQESAPRRHARRRHRSAYRLDRGMEARS